MWVDCPQVSLLLLADYAYPTVAANTLEEDGIVSQVDGRYELTQRGRRLISWLRSQPFDGPRPHHDDPHFSALEALKIAALEIDLSLLGNALERFSESG